MFKKKVLIGLMLVVLMLISIQPATAQQADGLVHDDLIQPRYVPCPFWQGDHQWVEDGSSWNTTEFYKYHWHMDSDGYMFWCKWKKSYKYQAYRCMCGASNTTKTYRGSTYDIHIAQ